jgi:hypothetical protein
VRAWGVGTWLAFAAPPVAMFVWGATYAVACLDELGKPLSDVAFSYRGERGPVRATARLAELDLGTGKLVARGVRVAEGGREQSADLLEVDFPTPWNLQGIYLVRASGVDAYVERFEDGTWSMDALVPLTKEREPTRAAYRIEVSDARLHFVDRYTDPVSTWTGRFSSVRALGAGPVGNVRFSGLIERTGSVAGSLDYGEGGVALVDVFSKNLSINDIKEYVGRVSDSELATAWSATSANYSGSIRIWRDGSEWRADGRGVFRVEDARYSGQRFGLAEFDGSFSEREAVGTFNIGAPGLTARATGQISFGDRPAGLLTGTISAADERSLVFAPKDWLPRFLAFRMASYDGSVRYGDRFEASGTVKASRIAYRDFVATDLTGRVATGGNVVRIANVSATVTGALAHGEFAYWPNAQGRVEGFATLRGADLKKLSFIPKEVQEGHGDADFALTGTLSKPQAVLRATGRATVAISNGDQRRLESLDFGFAGSFANQLVHLDAGEVSSVSGILRGSGSFGIDGSGLHLSMAASGVDIGAVPGLSADGIGFGDFSVSGSLSKPSVEGLFEIYSGRYQDYSLPFVSAFARYGAKEISLENIVARSGVSLITGSAKVNVSTSALSGSGLATDVGLGRLSDGLVQGMAEGAWIASGSLDDPILDVELVGTSLVVGQVEIPSAKATGQYRSGAVRLKEATASVGGGTLSASGNWAQKGDSSLTVSASNISARAFQGYLQPAGVMGGHLGGSATLEFKEGELANGAAQIDARELSVGKEQLGSGSFEASIADRKITLSGGVGSLDSYFVVERTGYDLDKNEFWAAMSTLDASLNQAARIAAGVGGETIAPEILDELPHLEGKYRLSAELHGRKTDDGVSLSSGELSASFGDVSLSGRNLGGGVLRLTKDEGIYRIGEATWEGGPVSLRLGRSRPNTIEEAGKISLDGEFYNIDASWFRNIEPRLGELYGLFDLSFVASGETKSPIIRADLNATGLRYGEISAEILTIGPLIIQDGSISGGEGFDPTGAVGKLQVRGFEALLTEVNLPFQYPFTFPEDKPLAVSVHVPSRDIDDLSKFFGGLEAEATSGTMNGGDLRIGGTYRDLVTTGEITAEAKELKFVALDTPLRDATWRATLTGASLDVSASGLSGFGGSFESRGLLDFGRQEFKEGSFVRFKDFVVSQGFGEGNLAKGKLDADLAVTGALAGPLVSGSAQGDAAALKLVGELSTSSQEGLLPIDPQFSIDLKLLSGSVTTSTLEALTRGQGKLEGFLSRPQARMDFAVEGGGMSLPSGRVRLEKGGSAQFVYASDWRGAALSSLVVDLNASTRVTADAGFGLRRYRIDLHITGDLLGAEELTIDAQSTPPDLSQSQMMAILGQQRAFEQIAGAAAGDFNAQLKSLLSSVVAPTVLGKLTESIERTFGLDYLSLDFSPSGVGGITIAKALGNGFSLEYRRVIEQYALVGEALEEIRLNYLLPSRNPLLGRLSLSVAADRMGLLKLSLGYTKRF